MKESQDKQLTLEETIENLEGYLKISENQGKIFLTVEKFLNVFDIFLKKWKNWLQK